MDKLKMKIWPHCLGPLLLDTCANNRIQRWCIAQDLKIPPGIRCEAFIPID